MLHLRNFKDLYKLKKKNRMVERQPRKSFESSCATVKFLQGCLLYRFLVCEELIDELSVILGLHLFGNTIIFIFSYPCFFFQTFTMTTIPSFTILSDTLKNILPVNFCEFPQEPSSVYYPLLILPVSCWFSITVMSLPFTITE